MERLPAIVAPVMRTLGTADARRSAAFFRDVLGFEIRENEGGMEAVRGPAVIKFGTHDYGPISGQTPRETGSAMVFFETGDVEAMHAAIRARGGNPGRIEKVNRVKMRMFELRDPDGHVLWFGQSYDVPVEPRPRALLRKSLPQLPFGDVAAAVTYYRDVLGFHINYQQADLGVMDRDQVTFLLVPRTERHELASVYVYVANADELYAELRAKGADIDGEPVSHPWGLRDFRVRDLEGNEIRFGQPFE